MKWNLAAGQSVDGEQEIIDRTNKTGPINKNRSSDTIIFDFVDKRFNDLTATEIRDSFIQFNNFPMGMMHHKGRLFITLPRRRPGMPATIAFIVANGSRGSSPSLQAYPDFRTNQLHVSRKSQNSEIINRA